uniref:Integrin beta subunit tail domain-containing protein n=1 Tax=Plectus sambesii TaxID=2011161 RepID=A0A914VB87_9BILA
MKKEQPLDAEELVPWVYAPQEIEEEPRRLALRRPTVLLALSVVLLASVVIGTMMKLHSPVARKDVDSTPNNLVACDQLQHQCKRTNESAICEGMGTCECGTCVCDQPEDGQQYHVSGTFCECDNWSCPAKDNATCSGNGQCKCGHCVCEIGYAGKDCSICTDGAHLALKHCDAYKECVLCHPSKSDPATESNCLQCPLNTNGTDSLTEKPIDEETAVQPCVLIDPIDSCAFEFVYIDNPDANITTVLIQKDKLCPVPVTLR